jgi:hypothetical protein
MHQRSCASEFDTTTRSCDVTQIMHPDLNKHINFERHLSFMLPYSCRCADNVCVRRELSEELNTHTLGYRF